MKDLSPLLRTYLFVIAGDIAIEVGIELLNSEEEDITDEGITEKIKARMKELHPELFFEENGVEVLKLNTVRKTLYKLYSGKLAQFRRIRDKSTGWFIYYWWHEFDLFEEILMEKKRTVETKLRERLNFEENNYFFVCKNCPDSNLKYNFDTAFELNFKCPKCSGPLEAQDNQEMIQFLKEKIVLIEKLDLSIN
jgi:transcription initiation factor TFIIE subunit alpha